MTPSDRSQNTFSNNIWLAERREDIRYYFVSREIICQRIPQQPVWSHVPLTSVWIVKGVGIPGLVGWYVIAGDHPTDIVGLGSFSHPAAVLRHFSTKWQGLAEQMMDGVLVKDFRFPTDADPVHFGEVISQRAERLMALANSIDPIP